MSKAMEMLATLLVFLLCSASTSFLPSQAAASSSATSLRRRAAVLDVNGQSVRPGQKYHVLPVIRGMGGGLAISDRGDMCPLYVAQAALEVDPGRNMTFTPVDPDDDVVRTSTDLNVQVSAFTICIQSNVWRLGDVEEDTGHRYVAIDGDKGNPGKETLSSWFRIEKYEERDHEYKFVFCPGVCDICRPVCGDLGIFIERNRRWLGITGDVPFPVQFRLAAETTKGTM